MRFGLHSGISETNFAFFQDYFGFGLTFAENMGRILEGVKGPSPLPTGGGVSFRLVSGWGGVASGGPPSVSLTGRQGGPLYGDF